MKHLNFISAALLSAILMPGATSCKGRTNDNVEPTGDTVEVCPMPATEADSMNHDAEAVTLPDAVEVPE